MSTCKHYVQEKQARTLQLSRATLPVAQEANQSEKPTFTRASPGQVGAESPGGRSNNSLSSPPKVYHSSCTAWNHAVCLEPPVVSWHCLRIANTSFFHPVTAWYCRHAGDAQTEARLTFRGWCCHHMLSTETMPKLSARAPPHADYNLLQRACCEHAIDDHIRALVLLGCTP